MFPGEVNSFQGSERNKANRTYWKSSRRKGLQKSRIKENGIANFLPVISEKHVNSLKEGSDTIQFTFKKDL